MLAYYAIYKVDLHHPPPISIMAYECDTGSDAIVWHRRKMAWVYDPGTANRLIWASNDFDRIEEIPRERAEEIAREITKATTGFAQELPDEETIYWIFQWKGQPPPASEE